jgi:hypothetical protein
MTEEGHIGGAAGSEALDRVLSALLPAEATWERSPAERYDYVVYSAEDGPRLILPRDVARGLRYSQVWARNGSLWKWTALRTAYRLRTLHRFPGVTPIRVHVPPGAEWSHIGWDGPGEPVLAVFVREPSASQKAVAFVGSDHERGPSLVVKAPLGADSEGRILAEASLLGSLGAYRSLRAHVPALRHVDRRRAVSAQEYVVGRRTGTELSGPHLEFLGRLAMAASTDASSALAGLLEELGTDSEAAGDIRSLGDALLSGDDTLAGLGAVVEHGDFYPWNLFDRDGSLVALDWEFGRETGLPLWDATHFHLRVSTSLRRLGRRAAVDALIADLSSDVWTEVRQSSGVMDATTARYLVAISIIRFFSGERGGRDVSDGLAEWVRTGTPPMPEAARRG